MPPRPSSTLQTLGRKRHILTDTLGLLLGVVVHPADIQDRDGAEPLLRQARRQFPFIERIIGDAGYQGPKMAAAVARTGPWEVQIIRRCDQHRFVVLPKRWIVERTIGWISHHRRLARDFERHVRCAAALCPPCNDPHHDATTSKVLRVDSNFVDGFSDRHGGR